MHEIIHGDCLEVMRGIDAGSVDAIVTDPPYELGFMGRKWDRSGSQGWRTRGAGLITEQTTENPHARARPRTVAHFAHLRGRHGRAPRPRNGRANQVVRGCQSFCKPLIAPELRLFPRSRTRGVRGRQNRVFVSLCRSRSYKISRPRILTLSPTGIYTPLLSERLISPEPEGYARTTAYSEIDA